MVPGVASSNLVTRPIKFNPTKTVGLNFTWSGQMRTGSSTKEQLRTSDNEVRNVAIWKGAHERREVGIYNLVTRPINKNIAHLGGFLFG